MEKKATKGGKKIRERVFASDVASGHKVRQCEHYREIIASLEAVASFITENLPDFTGANPTIEEKFDGIVAQFPQARLEIEKVCRAKYPTDVGAAGRFLAAVLNLKTTLEVRLAKRTHAKNHTYDGTKNRKYNKKRQGKHGQDDDEDEDNAFRTPPTKRPCRSPPCNAAGSETASAPVTTSASSTQPTSTSSPTSASSADPSPGAVVEDCKGTSMGAAVSRCVVLLTAPPQIYVYTILQILINIYIILIYIYIHIVFFIYTRVGLGGRACATMPWQ